MPQHQVPQLNAEQRAAALAKASATRHARAEICRDVKAGRRSVIDVLNSNDELILKMRVRSLLKSVPGYGRIKTDRLMAEIGITETRRIGGLGRRQKEALIEAFSA